MRLLQYRLLLKATTMLKNGKACWQLMLMLSATHMIDHYVYLLFVLQIGIYSMRLTLLIVFSKVDILWVLLSNYRQGFYVAWTSIEFAKLLARLWEVLNFAILENRKALEMVVLLSSVFSHPILICSTLHILSFWTRKTLNLYSLEPWKSLKN